MGKWNVYLVVLEERIHQELYLEDELDFSPFCLFGLSITFIVTFFATVSSSNANFKLLFSELSIRFNYHQAGLNYATHNLHWSKIANFLESFASLDFVFFQMQITLRLTVERLTWRIENPVYYQKINVSVFYLTGGEGVKWAFLFNWFVDDKFYKLTKCESI